MGIQSALVYAISDTIILCVQILFLTFISEKHCSKTRFAAVLFAAVITGFIFELFFGGMDKRSGYLLLIFNFPKLCMLAFLALKSISLKDVMMIMIIQFTCSVLNAAVTSLLSANDAVENPYINFIPMIAVPAFMLIALVVFERKSKYQNKMINGAVYSIPIHIFIFIFIALIIEDGLIEVLCYSTPKIDQQIKTVKILSLLLIICVTVLIISLTINVLYQKHYVRLNNILEEQVKSQLLHYQKREKIDAEIQSFRHDFNNHVKCLEALMSVNKVSEAMEYLEKISGMMPFGEFLFRTGNYISDAILTEAQENSAPNNVTVSFKGCIPQNIDSIDLCIILSNAMKNAVEACRDLPDSKTVLVYGNYQQEVFVLIIKNPTTLEGYAKDVFPKTSKPDKMLHGFGFSNMQYVVNKYGGTLHTLVENGIFTLSITLKLQ